jgi:hypothetical protein
MDDPEIERLRKAIRKTYAGQPHKVKFWLALLDMYSQDATVGNAPGGEDLEGRPGNSAPAPDSRSGS